MVHANGRILLRPPPPPPPPSKKITLLSRNSKKEEVEIVHEAIFLRTNVENVFY